MSANPQSPLSPFVFEKDSPMPSTSRRPRMHSRTHSVSSTSSKTSIHSMISHSTPSALVAKPKEAYGSFTITRSAIKSLRDTSYITTSHSRVHSMGQASRPRISVQTDVPNDDRESSPDSPLGSVPSITRASSPAQDTPFPPSFIPPHLTARRRSRTTSDLNPILANLERRSKFCAHRMLCSTCLKPGSDYPKCPRCAEAWCSRECRLRGGKRHECSTSKR